MQSSVGVAGRALIMLACVVGIPILAMSGTSWSEILKKVQDFPWPAILDRSSASTSTAASDGHPMASFDSATHTATAADQSLTPAWQGQSATAANSGVVPVAYQAPIDPRAGEPAATAPLARLGPSPRQWPAIPST